MPAAVRANPTLLDLLGAGGQPIEVTAAPAVALPASAPVEPPAREAAGMTLSTLDAQEVERKRIACELHDGIGQALSLIKLSVHSAAERLAAGAAQDATAILQRLLPDVAGALDEVRRLSMALHPSMLDDLGVVATLSWHGRELGRMHPDLTVETQIGTREEAIPPAVKLAIYRIVQEASHNAIRHARASSIRVALVHAAEGLVLSVCDDGCGFDPAVRPGRAPETCGLGLASMKERARLSGGRHELRSAPGEGTQVRVTWPLPALRD